MSQQLSDLSDVNRYGAPSFGLIEQRVELQMHAEPADGSRVRETVANAMGRRGVNE